MKGQILSWTQQQNSDLSIKIKAVIIEQARKKDNKKSPLDVEYTSGGNFYVKKLSAHKQV